MPANKYALLRYRIIDKAIRNKFRPYPTKEDLRLACEEALYNSNHERVSESTIEKDLFAMRNEAGLGYFAPIKFSREFHGYYYNDPDYSIDDLPLNDEDVEAIKFAANTLAQFKDIGVFDQFGSAIDKLIGRISISGDLKDEEVSTFVQFEDAPIAKGTEFLSVLLDAIKNKIEVLLAYKSFMVGVENVREFHPYLLKEYRNRWYVIGLDKREQKVKTFGLDRISSVRHVEKLFKPIESFNPDTYFKYSIGITTANNESEIIRLSFDSQQANYIRTQPIHESQTIIEDNEKLTIELNLIITPELIMQIQSFGSHVEVLKPKKLRNLIIEELRDNLKRYSN